MGPDRAVTQTFDAGLLRWLGAEPERERADDARRVEAIAAEFPMAWGRDQGAAGSVAATL